MLSKSIRLFSNSPSLTIIRLKELNKEMTSRSVSLRNGINHATTAMYCSAGYWMSDILFSDASILKGIASLGIGVFSLTSLYYFTTKQMMCHLNSQSEESKLIESLNPEKDFDILPKILPGFKGYIDPEKYDSLIIPVYLEELKNSSKT